MPIRLQDIATDLKLSKMTISKVLRGQTDVSAETKARVLKRAKELNYSPNVTARSLRTGLTYSAGLLVGSLEHPSFPKIVRGISEVLRSANYSLVIASAEESQGTLERDVEWELSRQVDLLFLHLPPPYWAEGEAQLTRDTPKIYLGRKPPKRRGLSVGLREATVGRVAAEHLLQRGSVRIAYLRGARTPVDDERFYGYLQALRAARIPARKEWVIQTQVGENSYRSGYEAASQLLAGRHPPDGIMTCNDLVAAGVRDALLTANVRIPEEVKIIGCGNQFEICEMSLQLSSIELAYAETGRRAARLGLKLLQSGSAKKWTSILVTPQVVQRYSTAGAQSAQQG